MEKGDNVYDGINTFHAQESGVVWGCCREGPQCCEFDWPTIDEFIESMEKWKDLETLYLDKPQTG